MTSRFARFNRKYAPTGFVFVDAARVRGIEPAEAALGNTAIHIDADGAMLTIYVNESPLEVYTAVSAISP